MNIIINSFISKHNKVRVALKYFVWNPETCSKLQYSWKCLAINIGDSIKNGNCPRTFEIVHMWGTCIHYVWTNYNDSYFFQRSNLSRHVEQSPRGRRDYRNPIIDRRRAPRRISRETCTITYFLARKHTYVYTCYVRFIPTRAIRQCKFLEYTMLCFNSWRSISANRRCPTGLWNSSLIVGEPGVLL